MSLFIGGETPPGLGISSYSNRELLLGSVPLGYGDFGAMLPLGAPGSHICLDLNPATFLLSDQLSHRLAFHNVVVLMRNFPQRLMY